MRNANTKEMASDVKKSVIDDLSSQIRMATSMSSILCDKLAKDDFEKVPFIDDNGKNHNHLKCRCCPSSSTSSVILIQDSSYKQTHGTLQPQWFRNLKKSLYLHLNREKHITHLKESNISENKERKIKAFVVKWLMYSTCDH